MSTQVFKRNRIDSDKIFDVVVVIILALVFAVAFYPLYFVIIASISDPEMVTRGEVFLLPKKLSLEAFSFVLRDPRILSGYTNTIFYTVIGTTISVIITLMAAFPLSRKEMVGYKFFIWFFLFTMYFKGGLIPTYLQVRNLGILNSRWAILLIGALGIWNLIIARTFFENTISRELWEAASIDGCNMYQFFLKIVLPLSKSIIAILVLYYAVWQWNDYFKALIYLNDRGKYPLQLILRDILLADQSVMIDADPELIEKLTKQAEGMKYSMIIVSSLPVIAMYPFVQKYFVKGVMIGSVKG